MSKPRDVVVVRVSEKGDREDEHFHSPEVQIEAARRWAKDRGERLVASPIPEIDVSGRLPLSKRPGLLAAIEMIEAGRADQLVVAYFDRLVRSLKVQLEVIERVERAGGEIFALDHGKLTNGTAAQRLSTNMLGSVFQYFAEITGEKVTAAQARAVARGVYPHPRIPVGYVRGEDGVLVVEPAAARVVVQAFKRRDLGASLVEIQALLAENGIERALSGVASMLRSRMYLGEIHFGELHNTQRSRGDRQGSRAVRAGAAADGLARAPSQVRAAAGPPGGAALRDVRLADGDQLRQRQLPLRRHEREPRAGDERRSRPTASRRWCWTRSGRTRPRPTRTHARRAGGRSARRTRRSNAPTRISMTRSGSSASLDCWAGPRARRPWRNSTKTLDDAHTARARLGDGGESDVIGPDDIDKLPRTREAASGVATADHRHRRVGYGRAGDDRGWAPQSPLGPSPDRHQVPRPASIRKPCNARAPGLCLVGRPASDLRRARSRAAAPPRSADGARPDPLPER